MNMKIIMPLFIAGIMVVSIIGFSFNSARDTRIKYKDKVFTKTDRGWLTYVGNKAVVISFSPAELEEIDVSGIKLSELSSARKLYLTFNPEENINQALYNFDSNVRPYLSRLVIACTKDVEKCSDLPLKTCDDATDFVKVIQIQESNESFMGYENNCLLIKGKGQELVKQIDALTLELLK